MRARVRKAGVLADLLVLALPPRDLVDAAAGIFIERNVVFGDELRIALLDPVRHVLGVVLARFGDVVAELAHDFETDHVPALVLLVLRLAPGVELFGSQGLDLGVQVAAVQRDLEQPSHVVDAGDLLAQPGALALAFVEVERVEQARGAALHGVAESHGLDAGAAQHRACEHGHRVRVVEQPCVGTDLLHLRAEVHHHGDRAQGSEDAPDAQRVRDRLAQAEALGNLEVRDRGGVVAADLDGVDHEGRALERLLAVGHPEIGLDRGAVAVDVLVERPQHQLGLLQARLVDVVERDFGVLERFAAHHVPQDVLGEDGAAGTHECDFGHDRDP